MGFWEVESIGRKIFRVQRFRFRYNILCKLRIR